MILVAVEKKGLFITETDLNFIKIDLRSVIVQKNFRKIILNALRAIKFNSFQRKSLNMRNSIGSQ